VQEAIRLFERRKNPEYLRTLIVIQLEASLRRLLTLDESKLTIEKRQQYSEKLAGMARGLSDIRELLHSSGRDC
jgi:hypothetical protein